MAASTRSISAALALGLGLAVVTAPLVTAPAYAQKATSDKEKKKLAKQYVDAGLAAQNAGDYDQAIELYQKAYEQVPHPVLWFNIAQAQRLAGRDEEALVAYQRYLEEDPQGPKVKEAQTFIKEIQPRVDKARADAAEKARLADEAETARQAAEARAAEAEQRRLAAEEERRKAEADAEAKRQAEDARPVASSGGGRKKLALGVGAGGLVIAAVGGVFGYLAMGAWDDAEGLCGDDLLCDSDADTDAANALADDARLRGNVSTVMIGVGAAAIVTGAILYLTAPSGGGKREHALLVVPSGDGAMVSWSGLL